jgi:hypothetical protein
LWKIKDLPTVASCAGHVSKDQGDQYETPTFENLAVEMRKFPRYEA